MKRRKKDPHAELVAWANGLRPDSPKREFVEPDEDSDHCEHDIAPRSACQECRENDE